jgi:hypothetical protein
VLSHPESITEALRRAHGGQWLPQELKARQENLRQGRAALGRQLERLTEAYLGEVIPLAEYHRRRKDLEQREEALASQEKQLQGQARQRMELAGVAGSIEDFCERVRGGLAEATFEQRRKLVELLIDRVIVTGEEVEIRYVIPTDPSSEQVRFCHLRSDYLGDPSTRQHSNALRGANSLCQSTCTPSLAHSLAHPISTSFGATLRARSRRSTLHPKAFSVPNPCLYPLRGSRHPTTQVSSRRVFRHVQVLVAGAILAPGMRTVASALRAMGLEGERHYCRCHRVLSRAAWSSREARRLLLGLLVEAFVPEGPLVLGVDETLERRRGKKVGAKGIYRDIRLDPLTIIS